MLSFLSYHSPLEENILCEDLGRMAQFTQASVLFNADNQPIGDNIWKEHHDHVHLKTERTGSGECWCPFGMLFLKVLISM